MTTEEEFTHTVDELTVGQVRQALANLPDDMPVRVDLAEEPGGRESGWPQVVIDVGDTVDGVCCISTDYPSGTYYRRTR